MKEFEWRRLFNAGEIGEIQFLQIFFELNSDCSYSDIHLFFVLSKAQITREFLPSQTEERNNRQTSLIRSSCFSQNFCRLQNNKEVVTNPEGNFSLSQICIYVQFVVAKFAEDHLQKNILTLQVTFENEKLHSSNQNQIWFKFVEQVAVMAIEKSEQCESQWNCIRLILFWFLNGQNMPFLLFA